jgi:hypothetical protein
MNLLNFGNAIDKSGLYVLTDDVDAARRDFGLNRHERWKAAAKAVHCDHAGLKVANLHPCAGRLAADHERGTVHQAALGELTGLRCRRCARQPTCPQATNHRTTGPGHH